MVGVFADLLGAPSSQGAARSQLALSAFELVMAFSDPVGSIHACVLSILVSLVLFRGAGTGFALATSTGKTGLSWIYIPYWTWKQNLLKTNNMTSME